MNMTEWAKNEVRIACERERKESGTPEGEWDYGCACYESALKAFESLLGDGHSGMSMEITKHIFNSLINRRPLTPIEDTDDVWGEVYTVDDCKTYQCKRMSSLFKKVSPNGFVYYSENNRYVCLNNGGKIQYYNGLIRKIGDELFPIKMPYIPEEKPYVFHTETFLVDPRNGDYDTKGVLYVITPGGERIEINRYFKEINGEMKEIKTEEYIFRKNLADERLAKMKGEVDV